MGESLIEDADMTDYVCNSCTLRVASKRWGVGAAARRCRIAKMMTVRMRGPSTQYLAPIGGGRNARVGFWGLWTTKKGTETGLLGHQLGVFRL